MTNYNSDHLDRIEALVEANARQIESNARAIQANSNTIAEVDINLS